MTRPRSRPPIGFAHRGARSECRDNTLASFSRALELGAEALETDAWLSADGAVVLDHDGRFRRGFRSHAVRAVDRRHLPAHVATLDELYATCGTAFELSIDVKDGAAAEPLLAVAGRAGAVTRLWLCSPDLAELGAWRAREAGAHLVHSTSLRALTGHRDGGDSSLVAERLSAHARRLTQLEVGALNLHHQAWTASRVTAVQQAGLAAFAWDAQDEATLRRLSAWHVDGVYSDHVALMVAVLRSSR